MNDRSRDDDTQQFETEYTDEDFLDAVRECRVASIPNVAVVVGCRRRTALRRLETLEERGGVGFETDGGEAKV